MELKSSYRLEPEPKRDSVGFLDIQQKPALSHTDSIRQIKKLGKCSAIVLNYVGND